MTNLIEFPAGRTAAPDYQTCECGSAWFRLVRSTPEGAVPGVVCVDQAGSVYGYSGLLECNDCGLRR